MNLKSLALGVIVAGALTAPGLALAAANGARPMQACKADLNQFCQSVERGGGGKMRCLRDNRAKLSAECSSAIEARRAERQAARKLIRQACTAEKQNFCQGGQSDSAASGDGRRGGLIRCLRRNEAQLSPGCGQALAALPQRRRRGGTQQDRMGLGQDGAGQNGTAEGAERPYQDNGAYNRPYDAPTSDPGAVPNQDRPNPNRQ